MWDLKTGRCLRKFSGHTDGVTFVMPGPEGRVLTASEDRTIRAWDVETGECVRTIRSHSGAVTGLCMASPDRIVTCSADKKIRVFDTNGNICGEAELDGEIMAVASPPPLVPPTPSPQGEGSGGSVNDPLQEEEPRNDESTDPTIYTPSPLVRVVACGGVQIPAPVKPMLRRVDVKIAAMAGAISPNTVSRYHTNLCTAPYEREEAEDDEEDDDDYLEDPDKHRAPEKGIVTCVAISALEARGGSVLIAGSYDTGVRVLRNVFSTAESRGSVRESNRDPVTGKRRVPSTPVMQLRGRHKEGVRSVAISADGRWAVSGGREGHVKVWEIAQHSAAAAAIVAEEQTPAEHDFQAHRGVVFSLCLSPDARLLISAGSDKDVRVWDLSLVVYARRLVVNRSRALWADGRIRRARPKRSSGNAAGASTSLLSRTGAGGVNTVALKAFHASRELRQQILESLFALPDSVYAKVLMYI